MKTPTEILRERLKEITSCKMGCISNENRADIPKLIELENSFKDAIKAINKAKRLRSENEIIEAIKKPKTGRPKGQLNKIIIDHKAKRDYPIIMSNGKEFKRLKMEDVKF